MPPFCGGSAGLAAARSSLQSSSGDPQLAAAAAAATMLSARVAAALARSLPRQAGLVSAISPPWGEQGTGAAVAAILAVEAAVTLRRCGLPLFGVWGEGCVGKSPPRWVTVGRDSLMRRSWGVRVYMKEMACPSQGVEMRVGTWGLG